MAGDALFIGLGEVVRGREKKALGVFAESMEYYGKLQQDGLIESFEPFLLAPHGGDIAGFVLLRGERAQLDEIRRTPEFERLITRASSIIEKPGVVPAYGGEALGQMMGLFEELRTSSAANPLQGPLSPKRPLLRASH